MTSERDVILAARRLVWAIGAMEHETRERLVKSYIAGGLEELAVATAALIVVTAEQHRLEDAGIDTPASSAIH